MNFSHSTISKSTGLICIAALLTQLASGCTIVMVDGILTRSSVEVRLTKEGKPLSNAAIDIYLGKPNKTTNDLAYLSLTTNSDGSAVIRDLSTASYYLIIRSTNSNEPLFDLDVPLEHESRTLVRGIEFLATPIETKPTSSSGGALSQPMTNPLRASLQQFRGTVADFTGAVIPNTEIKVYAAGKTSSEPVLNFGSDEKGEFAANLHQGKYVAVFTKKGFVVQPVDFSIDPSGWKAMRLSLAIGGSNCGNTMPHDQSKIVEY